MQAAMGFINIEQNHHQNLLGGIRGVPATDAGGFQLRDEL